MTSETDICNRALQKLGAKTITSLTQDSVNARACNVAYPNVRDGLLRAYVWNFAVSRVQLPAEATEPLWGGKTSYQLPSDFLRLANSADDYRYCPDWQIEGQKILASEGGPLNLRYVARVEDPRIFDPIFRELLATELAYELCDAITQSNTKKAGLAQDLKEILSEAKKVNAFESVSQFPPEDDFITARM